MQFSLFKNYEEFPVSDDRALSQAQALRAWSPVYTHEAHLPQTHRGQALCPGPAVRVRAFHTWLLSCPQEPESEKGTWEGSEILFNECTSYTVVGSGNSVSQQNKVSALIDLKI